MTAKKVSDIVRLGPVIPVLAFDSGSESHMSFLPRAGVMWAGPHWVPLDAPSVRSSSIARRAAGRAKSSR